MQLQNATLMLDGKQTCVLEEVSLSPVGRCFDVKFDGRTLKCSVQYSEGEWAKLLKLLAQVVRIEVPNPIPGVKKGDTVTIHADDGFGDREVTGTLYHIRKPRKYSDARIYFIRELPPHLR